MNKKLERFSDRQLRAELKAREQKKMLEIPKEDLDMTDKLRKEARALGTGETTKINIGPVIVELKYVWEDAEDTTILYEGIKNKQKDKESKFIEEAVDSYVLSLIDNYAAEDILDSIDVPAATNAYKAFKKRIDYVCRESDKLAKKNRILPHIFFEEFIG